MTRLGDSIRRRRPPPRAPRDRAERPAGRRPGGWRLSWGAWLLAAVLVTGISFVVGYLLATRVFFAPPVSAGTGIVVPDLYGMERSEAEASIRRLGLETGPVTGLASAESPEGRVLAQAPVPGQQLRAGAVVAFAVSVGPPEVRVPPVAGLTAATAQRVLESAGFQVQLEGVRVSGVAAGVATRSEPGAGSAVRQPAVVTVLVNAPPVDPGPD